MARESTFASREIKHTNGEKPVLTVEKLKAATRGKNVADIAKDLDRDITELKRAHRVSADTLKKQISV